MTALRIGTRGSDLAVAQSRWVAARITEASGVPCELVVVSTRGDRDTSRPLAQLGGKGLFTAELEEGLREGALDLAVHSLKDLPTEDPAGLVIGAVPVREDPRDAWVGPAPRDLGDTFVLGTGSLRRQAQARARWPGADARDIRGNVATRLSKRDQGHYDAVILAMAGLRRLGIVRHDVTPIDVDTMVPAVGQGALAVQCRGDDPSTRDILARIEDPTTRTCIDAERAFLRALGGGCNVPAGCHAVVLEDGRLRLVAMVADAAGTVVREEVETDDGVEAGMALGRALRGLGT